MTFFNAFMNFLRSLFVPLVSLFKKKKKGHKIIHKQLKNQKKILYPFFKIFKIH